MIWYQGLCSSNKGILKLGNWGENEGGNTKNVGNQCGHKGNEGGNLSIAVEIT